LRTQNYRAEIVSDLSPTDPLVVQRLALYQQSANKYTIDQALEQNQAYRNLNQIVTREAQVRAYNDVIALNGIFAILLLIWSSFNITWTRYQLKKQQQALNSS
jgi:hypothetical protein